MSGTILVARSAVRAVTAHARGAWPNEACGILFGVSAIERAIAARNVSSDPTRRFEIDPAFLIAAHKAERAGGARLAGYYHSHPNGPPVPSAADREGASGDARVWAIVGRAGGEGWEVRFWRDWPSGFEELSSTVVGG